MTPASSEQPNGYPPVTESEERTADRAVESGGRDQRGTDISRGLDTSQADMTDAITALFDKHRVEIDAAAISGETRRFALDLLHTVRRDTLQAILGRS